VRDRHDLLQQRASFLAVLVPEGDDGQRDRGEDQKRGEDHRKHAELHHRGHWVSFRI